MLNKRLFFTMILLIATGLTGCAGIPKVYLKDCRMVYGNNRSLYSVIQEKDPAFLSLGQSVPKSQHPMAIGKTYDVSYGTMWDRIKKVIEKFNGNIIVEDKKGGVFVFRYYERGRMPNSMVPFKMDDIRWRTYINVFVKKAENHGVAVHAFYYTPLLYSVSNDDRSLRWIGPGYIDSQLRCSGDKGIEFTRYVDADFFATLDGLIKK